MGHPRPRRIAWAATVGLSLTAVVTAPGWPTSALPARAVDTQAPLRGGVLNVLTTNAVDYLDPNVSYYPVTYGILHAISRQLYGYRPAAGETTTPVPDLATGMPQVRDHGRVYRVTLRKGVRWDTTSPREVTAADVVRGVEISCNPAQPSGAVGDIAPLIAGMTSFCRHFSRVQPTATAIRRFLATHAISGVRATSRHIVVFRLRRRAGDFPDLLALPVFSPRAKQTLRFVPGSSLADQHTVSDGPYEVASYRPVRRLVLTRNPAWRRDTDPLRPAYVNRIVISLTWDAPSGASQIRSGSPTADLYLGPLPTDLARRRLAAGDPRLVLAPSVTLSPYLVFNTASPNNAGALGERRVRRALAFALRRDKLIAAAGGRRLNPPLRHLLPRAVVGSEAFNPFAHDRSRARRILRDTGATRLTLKFLYRSSSPAQAALLRATRQTLRRVGISVKGVPAADADFYTKYLLNPPSAEHGRWDLAAVGWAPDWFGNAARAIVAPLFDGRRLPPESSNYGLFDDPTVDAAIDAAGHARGRRAARRWHRVDRLVMADAAAYPITSPRTATYRSGRVQDYVFVPAFEAGDLTAVWLQRSGG